jgi:TM2 domain-containing membrane protein YozV
LFWFASFFGVLGLHRFYLGKTGSGILYLFTGGLFGIGAFVDFFTIPEQVREAKIKARMRRVIDDRLLAIEDEELGRRGRPQEKESLEHVILRVAKQHHGLAAPAEVALEAKIPVDDARKQLDKLVEKGVAEVRVRKNGTIVYALPDFLDDTANSQLEAF